ncbi:EF-hand domain-containing protein [Thalassospira sp. MA62]|nr:EF-hand domain-containing protein [Thalassospira sp. MA62]
MKTYLSLMISALVLMFGISAATALQGPKMMTQQGQGMMQGQGPNQNQGQWQCPGFGQGSMMPYHWGGMMGSDMMIIMMDTNGDGKLSLDEFQAVHARMLKYLDADGDGQLSADEVHNR